jgi:hypothetical protein
MQAVVGGGRGENLDEVPLGPTFDIAIEQRMPDAFPVAGTSNIAGIGDADNMEGRATPRERL